MNSARLSKDDVIRRIEQLGGTYDPESALPLEDQLMICESLVQSTPVDPNDEDGKIILKLKEEENKRNGSVNGSVNGIGKRQENVDETNKKKQAIIELTTFNYRTSPKKIALQLQIVFSMYPSKEGHWLYIAQHYTPKSINCVIHQMTKTHVEGWQTIKNPSSYFTDVLKQYHPMRKHKRSVSRTIDKI